MTKKTDYQKKYWWLSVIVVPILAALIGQLTGIFNLLKPPAPPKGNYTTNNMYLITQVFNTGEVSQDAQQKIEDAISLTQSGNYTDAIPLLEQVSTQYPVAAIYNDLGVLYALTGNDQKAQEAFQNALKGGLNNQAVNLNLGRLAESLGNTEEAKQYFSKAPDLNTTPSTPVSKQGGTVSITVNTQVPGVTAELTEFSKFQNTITLKMRLINSSANDVGYCGRSLLNGYLLDEETGKKYGNTSQGIDGCALSVGANSSIELWVKYSLPVEDHPQYLSAILGDGIIFEHLELK